MHIGQHDEFAPVTPGEILAEEFLAGYGMSQAALARALEISPNRIAEIVNNRRRISADTAVRLGHFFGTTSEFWMNLQSHYDLKIARRALSQDATDRIAARSMPAPHWPKYEDDLPQYPDWKERHEDGCWSWATRLASSAFGVDIRPAAESEDDPSAPSKRFHVEVVILDPEEQWTGPVIQEKWVDTLDEALSVASNYRERLEPLAAEAVL